MRVKQAPSKKPGCASQLTLNTVVDSKHAAFGSLPHVEVQKKMDQFFHYGTVKIISYHTFSHLRYYIAWDGERISERYYNHTFSDYEIEPEDRNNMDVNTG